MASLIALISALCVFGLVSLFIFSLMTTATRMYAEGERRIGAYVVDRAAIDPKSLAALASKFGLAFLPLNERLRDADLLGVGQMLARWEHQLVRAGLRSGMTAEQFLGVCQISATGLGTLFLVLTQIMGLSIVGGIILGYAIGGTIG